MNFAMIGGAIVDGVKKIPAVVWWLVIGIIFFKWVELSSISRGKKEEGTKRDKESAEVESKVISQITENSNAMVRESDAVRSHTSAERLPDGTATLPEYNYRD